MRARLTLLLPLLLLLTALPGSVLAERRLDPCSYSQGFQVLHDLIPDVVGDCATDPEPQLNGDVLQQTANGLLVWRKADNWTAFTDGTTTWINGPCGLQSRPNDQTFPWENGGPCEPAPTPVPSPSPTATQPPPNPSGHPWPDVEHYVFGLINRDRQANGLAPVIWDQVASDAGFVHAREMAQAGYTGHLDLAGLFPQQRYTLAGGRDYVAENVACGTPASSAQDLQTIAARIQELMLSEAPPNDGHRRNILNPERTGVGVGAAWEGSRFCLTQEFINRYVTLDGFPAEAGVGQGLRLVGRAADGYSVFAIGLGYLPPSVPLTVQDAAASTSYRESDVFAWLPVAIDPDGVFRTDAAFSNPSGAGRYQLFVWVQDGSGRQILAANPIADVR